MGECQFGGTPSCWVHWESAANGDHWRDLRIGEGVVQPRPGMTSGNRFGGKDWRTGKSGRYPDPVALLAPPFLPRSASFFTLDSRC